MLLSEVRMLGVVRHGQEVVMLGPRHLVHFAAEVHWQPYHLVLFIELEILIIIVRSGR